MHRYIDELRLLQAIRLAVLATDAVGDHHVRQPGRDRGLRRRRRRAGRSPSARPDRARRQRGSAGPGRGDRW